MHCYLQGRRTIFRRAIIVLLLVGISAGTVFAQSVVNLHDPVYRDLQEWQGAGLISQLPRLQPWSVPLVVQALEELVDNPRSTTANRELAERYLRRFRGEARGIQAMGYIDARGRTGSDAESHVQSGFGVDAAVPVHPLVHVSLLLNPVLLDGGESSSPVLPHSRREPFDWIPDWSSVEIGGREIDTFVHVSNYTSVGNAEFSLFAGFARSNYGPFFTDSIALSAKAPFGAQYGYTWHRDLTTFSFLYRPITASNNRGNGQEPDKHLVFSSAEVRPFDWLQLAFYQTMVWGERFDLNYFVPFSSLFHAQGIGGFEGNSLLGAAAELVPLAGVRIPFTVNVDDLHYNDIVRFQFDTKYKLAAQTGLQWYPAAHDVPMLRFAALDYTAIMPYMYTHSDELPQNDNDDDVGEWAHPRTYNYSNYTHLGQNMATGLPPNSDRLRLQLDTAPLDWLRVGAGYLLMRHGNASAGVFDSDTATGDLWDPGYDEHTATFQGPYEDPTGQPYTRWLTQDVLEVVQQLELGAEAELPLTDYLPRLVLDAEYVFEHRRNDNLVEGETAVQHFARLGVGVRY